MKSEETMARDLAKALDEIRDLERRLALALPVARAAGEMVDQDYHPGDQYATPAWAAVVAAWHALSPDERAEILEGAEE